MRKEPLPLRMQRQHLDVPVDVEGYDALYRDLQPGMNAYWHGFGQPPELTFRVNFDDIDYNRERQARRELIKGRLPGEILDGLRRMICPCFPRCTASPS